MRQEIKGDVGFQLNLGVAKCIQIFLEIGASPGAHRAFLRHSLRARAQNVGGENVNADFREPLTLLISAHLRALSVPTFGVIVELRCINAGTDKSIHGGSYAR